MTPTATAKLDERKVFCDNVQQLMSVEVGLGGVWLIALPRLLFIPDRNGDDVPEARRKSCSTASRPRPKTITTAPTACAGDPTAGSMAAAGRPVPAGSARPAAARKSACRSTAAFGVIIRRARFSKSSATASPIPGARLGRIWRMFITNTVTGHLFHLIPGAHHTRSATLSAQPPRL